MITKFRGKFFYSVKPIIKGSCSGCDLVDICAYFKYKTNISCITYEDVIWKEGNPRTKKLNRILNED